MNLILLPWAFYLLGGVINKEAAICQGIGVLGTTQRNVEGTKPNRIRAQTNLDR